MFISAVYGVLYRSVCVGTGGLCSPGCGRGVCSGGSWWMFKVLGLGVFVIKSLRRLWVFSVVVRLDSGNSPNRGQATSFLRFLSHTRAHTW